MMNTALKEMQALLPDTKLSGKCLFTQEEDPPLLVIEDLAPLGFRMADRQAGLNLQHSLVALRGLAKFHASSIAVYEKVGPFSQIKDHLARSNCLVFRRHPGTRLCTTKGSSTLKIHRK